MPPVMLPIFYSMSIIYREYYCGRVGCEYLSLSLFSDTLCVTTESEQGPPTRVLSVGGQGGPHAAWVVLPAVSAV